MRFAMTTSHLPIRAVAAAALLASLSLIGCNTGPRYVDPPVFVEVGIPDSMVNFATQQVILPMRLETEEEAMERATMAAEFGGIQVPYVLMDDISVSIEWTIRNLNDSPGTARIHINGGNELFYYVPQNFVVDPEEDEEPPPLMGNIPIDIPALGTVTGVFREDQVAEAALDMELISRGGMNPFAAVYEQHDDVTEAADPATGSTIPRAAFGHLVVYDISLQANRHMILEFTLRVRDERLLLHDFLLNAPAAELTGFMPTEFVPPPPPAP